MRLVTRLVKDRLLGARSGMGNKVNSDKELTDGDESGIK